MNFDFDIANIISYLNSSEIQTILLPVKIIFLLIFGFFLAMIIFILLKTHYLQWLFFRDLAEFLTRRPYGAKKITRSWGKILRRLETGPESEYKLAVIEADNMLDVVLKRLGYTGATLEERLGKLTSATVPNIAQIYEAHKIRNNIVYDPDYRLSLDEAKRTVGVYGQAFRDLQILT